MLTSQITYDVFWMKIAHSIHNVHATRKITTFKNNEISKKITTIW